MQGVIIGISGRKRSGKDTIADYLVREHGFVRVAFADPLKEALLALDPWIYDKSCAVFERLSSLVDQDASKSIRDRFEAVKDIPEVRGLLQRYGVLIRELNEDFWVDAAMDEINRLWEERDHSIPGFVIPDVRFLNEALAVEDNFDGYVWRVERPGLPMDDTHISETALDLFDPSYVLTNDGTLNDLYRQVDLILKEIS